MTTVEGINVTNMLFNHNINEILLHYITYISFLNFLQINSMYTRFMQLDARMVTHGWTGGRTKRKKLCSTTCLFIAIGQVTEMQLKVKNIIVVELMTAL